MEAYWNAGTPIPTSKEEYSSLDIRERQVGTWTLTPRGRSKAALPSSAGVVSEEVTQKRV